jgi:hypothetical protein
MLKWELCGGRMSSCSLPVDADAVGAETAKRDTSAGAASLTSVPGRLFVYLLERERDQRRRLVRGLLCWGEKGTRGDLQQRQRQRQRKGSEEGLVLVQTVAANASRCNIWQQKSAWFSWRVREQNYPSRSEGQAWIGRCRN